MRIPFAALVCLVIGSLCTVPGASKNAGWNGITVNGAELAGSVTTSGPPIAGALHAIAATGAGSADLAIAVTASPDPVPSHWPIVYTIKITNLGPDVATSVTVTDPGQPFPGLGIGNLTLNPDESKMLIVARTVTAQPGSTQVLTATASGDQADPNPDNNTTTISTPVVQAVPVIEFV